MSGVDNAADYVLKRNGKVVYKSISNVYSRTA